MEIAEASIVGLFKILLIIIGAIVVLRFFGQLTNTKRNITEQNRMKESEKEFAKEKKRKSANLGKTNVIGKKSERLSDVVDVEFEEID